MTSYCVQCLLLGIILSFLFFFFSTALVCALWFVLDVVTESCQCFMLQQALHCHVFSIAQYFISCSLVIQKKKQQQFFAGAQMLLLNQSKK